IRRCCQPIRRRLRQDARRRSQRREPCRSAPRRGDASPRRRSRTASRRGYAVRRSSKHYIRRWDNELDLHIREQNAMAVFRANVDLQSIARPEGNPVANIRIEPMKPYAVVVLESHRAFLENDARLSLIQVFGSILIRQMKAALGLLRPYVNADQDFVERDFDLA